MTLFDTHVHTKESSNCGQASGREMARIYKNAGYDGIVITDHITPWYWRDAKAEGISWEEFAKHHMQGYLEAKKEGDKIGLNVLYGCEMRFCEISPNDYLTYGMTQDFIIQNPDMLEWNVKIFKEKAEENGFIFFQAHPFRNDMQIINPKDLFGVEVFNGNPREASMERNIFAKMWADKFGLMKIAGSDAHISWQTARAGVCFYNDVKTIEDFVTEIKAQRYTLVENPTAQKVCGEIFDE